MPKSMEAMFLQPSNVDLLTVVTLPRFTDLSPVQFLKAYSPKDVVPFKSMLVKLVQPEKT